MHGGVTTGSYGGRSDDPGLLSCDGSGGGEGVTAAGLLSQGTDSVIETDAFGNKGFRAKVALEGDQG